MTTKKINSRLEYLRGEIIAECISYSEIFELQTLSQFIDTNDTLLLEWAGVPENDEELINKRHDDLRTVLIAYGNEEFGDCIIYEICDLFDYPNTIDKYKN